MGRRMARSMSAQPAPLPPPPALYGSSGHTTSNYWSTSGGEVGADTGFLVFVAFTVTALADGTRVMLSKLSTSPFAGYELRLNTNVLQALAATGSGTLATVSGHTFVDGDLGKVQLAALYYDGADTLRLYRARAQDNTGACVGYTPATADLNLGRRPNATSGAANIELHGEAAFTGTPSLAQIQAYYSSFKNTHRLQSTLGGCVCTQLVNFPASAPASITATVGDDLTRNGTLTGTSESEPEFSW